MVSSTLCFDDCHWMLTFRLLSFFPHWLQNDDWCVRTIASSSQVTSAPSTSRSRDNITGEEDEETFSDTLPTISADYERRAASNMQAKDDSQGYQLHPTYIFRSQAGSLYACLWPALNIADVSPTYLLHLPVLSLLSFILTTPLKTHVRKLSLKFFSGFPSRVMSKMMF